MVAVIFSQRAARYLIECCGISEVDIKRIEPYYHKDAYKVTLWNRRKFDVDGMAVVCHARSGR